jgi:hypothetical protein
LEARFSILLKIQNQNISDNFITRFAVLEMQFIA